MEKKRNTTEFRFRISFIFLLSVCTIVFSSSSTSAITCLDTSCPTNAKFQELKEEIVQDMMSEGITQVSMSWSRRLLQGRSGSLSPRCISMCDKCTPCEPVQVKMPPETLMPTEYYPLAWRCKCGDNLYKPG